MRAPDTREFAITIGSYELLEGIGSDAVSEVWIARSTDQSNRVLRLVRLKSDALSDAESREAFLGFMRRAATRHSPLLLRVLAVAAEGDSVYAVLEHVEGLDLSTLLSIARDDGERLPTGMVLRFLLDVVSALEALGKPHGDLTPKSVHVTAGGVTVLSPICLAVAACRAPRDGPLRRLAYKAPEQIAGQQIGGSARADVFALGAILYEALTGLPLVPGTDGEDIAGAQVMALPPDTDDLPGPLAKVLQRALAQDPAKRYAGPSELGQALEKAVPELIADRHQIATEFWRIAGNDVAARRFELESLMHGATQVAIEEAHRSSFPPPRSAEDEDEASEAAQVAAGVAAAESGAGDAADEAAADGAEAAEAGNAAPDRLQSPVADEDEDEDEDEEPAAAPAEAAATAEADEPPMVHQRSIPPERSAQTRRVVMGVVIGAVALLALGLIVRHGHQPPDEPTVDTAATQASATTSPKPLQPAPPATAVQTAATATATGSAAPPAPSAAPAPPEPSAPAPSQVAPSPPPKPVANNAPVPAPVHRRAPRHVAARMPVVHAAPAPTHTARPAAPVKHVASFGALPPVPAKPKPAPANTAPVQKAPF